MIHTLYGKVILLNSNFLVIEVGGVGFKIFCQSRFLAKTHEGDNLRIFTFLQVKEDGWALYGFEDKSQLSVFELLNSINGVGPKSAMAIMSIAEPKELLSAIKEARVDLLVKATGVGSKLAERIVLELKDKIQAIDSAGVVAGMDDDFDLVEILVNLGYKKDQARLAAKETSRDASIEGRLKEALRFLARKKN